MQNLTGYLKPHSTVILGVSGGPDSVYLFHRILELKDTMNLKIIVAHINHGLRGNASNADEKFVHDLCKKHKIPLKTKVVKLRNEKGNLEETGRTVRYDFFESLRKKHRADWIMTAHHLNDNIETALFNLIRGAHLNGIRGMQVSSPDRHLLRPLLGTTKQEILSHLQKHKIKYRLDQSNNDVDFSRNWLRKKILPLFPRLNANFEQTFKETLHNLTETSQYLEHLCEKWLAKNMKKFQIELNVFLKEHHIFQKQILSHLYQKTHGSTRRLTGRHLEEILGVLHLRQTNRKKEFGPDTFMEIIWGPEKKQRYIRLTRKK